MGIRIDHGGGVAAHLATAYGTGQASTRQRMREQKAQVDERRREQELQREFTLERDQSQRDFTLERDSLQRDFTLDRDQAGQAFTLERDSLGQEFQLGRDEGQREFVLERDQAQLDRFGEQLTAQQRHEWNRLEDAYEQASASGDYSEEELADLKRQIDAKKMGIRPTPRMQESPFPKGQGIGEIWEQEGTMFTRDHQGIPKEIGVQARRMEEQRKREEAKRLHDLQMQAIEAARDHSKGGKVDMEEAKSLFKELQAWDLTGEGSGDIIIDTGGGEKETTTEEVVTGKLLEEEDKEQVLAAKGKALAKRLSGNQIDALQRVLERNAHTKGDAAVSLRGVLYGGEARAVQSIIGVRPTKAELEAIVKAAERQKPMDEIFEDLTK